MTKLSERREQKKSETRAAKKGSKSPGARSVRSKSSGGGSSKPKTRKVNVGGAAILSKSSKDL